MISAVVLAAGESRRMGTKKELLPIEGTPMIRLVVDELLASSKIDEVIVVLGAHADEVGLALSGIIDERLELVWNRRFSEGMGTSLAQGVSACSWGTDAILVVLGDAPFFHVEDVERLIDSHSHGAAIAVPVSAGRRGHPVLMSGTFREELEDLDGDTGAKHILEHNADRITEVAIDDDGFLVDVDDMDDYEAVKNGIERD